MLDAWPLVRYAEDVPAIVAEIDELLEDPLPTFICSINLGEAHYTLARRYGYMRTDHIWDHFCRNAQVEVPTLDVTYNAAHLSVTSRIPWADAHAAAMALAFDAVVWASDKHLNKPGPWKRRDLRKLGISPQDRRKR